jgi:autotransporter-associated beta strand protein
MNGGTLNLNNAAQTIENLSGAGGTINLALGHTLTSAAAGNTAYSGTIAGQGALVIANAFTLALNGTNLYTGGTTVNAGVLEVGGSILGDVTVASAGGLKLDNAAALASGATLNLAASPAAGTVILNFTGTQSIFALYFGAASQAPGTWGGLGSLAQHEDAAFTGTGWLSVVPEPASIIALAVGMVSLLGMRRRRS